MGHQTDCRLTYNNKQVYVRRFVLSALKNIYLQTNKQLISLHAHVPYRH